MAVYGLGDLGSDTRRAEPIPGIGSALGAVERAPPSAATAR